MVVPTGSEDSATAGPDDGSPDVENLPAHRIFASLRRGVLCKRNLTPQVRCRIPRFTRDYATHSIRQKRTSPARLACTWLGEISSSGGGPATTSEGRSASRSAGRCARSRRSPHCRRSGNPGFDPTRVAWGCWRAFKLRAISAGCWAHSEELVRTAPLATQSR